MPTRSSSAVACWRADRAEAPRCNTRGSATCCPMLCTGLSAVMGSWKIMPMRFPRKRRSSESARPSSSCWSNRMLPEVVAWCGSRPNRAMAVIDLPQPDSPIRPRVSPLSKTKLTSRTAAAGPRWVCSCTLKCRTSSRGIYRFRARRGSSRSRRPSPSRFRPSTADAIAMPGNTARRGAWNSRVCASASMRPQDGWGGWVPKPR